MDRQQLSKMMHEKLNSAHNSEKKKDGFDR